MRSKKSLQNVKDAVRETVSLGHCADPTADVKGQEPPLQKKRFTYAGGVCGDDFTEPEDFLYVSNEVIDSIAEQVRQVVVVCRGGCGLAWSRPSMRAVLPGVWSRLRRALRVLRVGAAACARGDGE